MNSAAVIETPKNSETAIYRPGPWHVIESEENGHQIFLVGDKSNAEIVCGALGLGDAAKQRATFISAAPDMAEALKELLADFLHIVEETGCGRHIKEGKSVTMARAALAKAAG